eukprot:2549437-Alexandrium_andersonii.AAC.1
MGHAELAQAIERKAIPLEERLAFLRLAASTSLVVEVDGEVAPPVQQQRGVRQGGRATPFLWNVLLD